MHPKLIPREFGSRLGGFQFWAWAFLGIAAMATPAQAAESVRLWKATPARPYLLRGADRRLLDRAEQFFTDKQWDDALAALLRLLESDNPQLVAIDNHRYISLQQYCHRRLTRFPKPQLLQYRALVDPIAESWYQKALAERNDQLLQRIVDQHFCSTWTDDSLFALGELALQRGDPTTARNAWLRISPKLDPTSQQLAYPDTDLPLATVQARLTLVSIRQGDWHRAEQELSQLKENYPTAKGRLAGRDRPLAEYLSTLLQQARKWPQQAKNYKTSTFATNPQRTNAPNATDLNGSYKLLWSRPLAANRLSIFPIVVDDLVVYQDNNAVHALNLANGELAFTAKGAHFKSPNLQPNHLGQPRHTLTASNHQAVGTTPALLGPRRNTNGTNTKSKSICWSINTRRDGALDFRLPSENSNITFAGAPLIVKNQFYLAIRSNDQTARAGIACYDLNSQQLRWQRWLCQANTPATGWTNEWPNNLLSYDAETLYACTNLGAIAALRADNGKTLWLRTYPRQSTELTSQGKCEYYRGPNPCIIHCGQVFSLPTDSNLLLALDAATGTQLWQAAVTDPDARLIGISENRLLVANNGLQIYDSATGQPTTIHTQDKLTGHPVLLHQTVAWPTDTQIQFISLVDNKAALKSVDLPSGGANLIATGKYLLASGPTQLTVYQIAP